jgi:hypothetical protein
LEALEDRDENAEAKKTLEEVEDVEQCLEVCADASERVRNTKMNEFEDVSAAQDAHQMIVLTLGHLVSATRVTAGVGATQCLGQMSDTTLQQLLSSRGVDLSDSSSKGKIPEHIGVLTRTFEDQHATRHGF